MIGLNTFLIIQLIANGLAFSFWVPNGYGNKFIRVLFIVLIFGTLTMLANFNGFIIYRG